MNFKEILDSEAAWESYEDKDSKKDDPPLFENLRSIKVDDRIDLHGMTIAQAEGALNVFFDKARASRFKKVLIIHGKGNHSERGGILKKWVQKYLDSQPGAGKRGTPGRDMGGSGATWVIIKE